jgi:transcription elongation factor GreA
MTSNTLPDNKILLTPDGHKSLIEEYENLTKNKRPEIVEEIQKSRELGDLSENGYYHAAREKQSFIEGRIREIEDILKRVEVVDEVSASAKFIGLGAKVKLEMQKNTIEFHLVGPTEVNSAINKISHESPIGKALLGKKVGDIVEVEAPVGKIIYKVIEIN